MLICYSHRETRDISVSGDCDWLMGLDEWYGMPWGFSFQLKICILDMCRIERYLISGWQ